MTRPLEDIMDEVCGTHEHNMQRSRPYAGQSHTVDGRRGAVEIKGITFRDLRDAFIRAAFLSTGPGPQYQQAALGENATLSIGDLQNLDLSAINMLAWFQNLSCEIERMMAIFPNLPKHSPDYRPPMEGMVIGDHTPKKFSLP